MAVKHFPMAYTRAAIALDPSLFGRARAGRVSAVRTWGLSDDLKLFATAFAAGFLFVSILIA
jgi:hypothetical protein